jgi:hypothetical protein
MWFWQEQPGTNFDCLSCNTQSLSRQRPSMDPSLGSIRGTRHIKARHEGVRTAHCRQQAQQHHSTTLWAGPCRVGLPETDSMPLHPHLLPTRKYPMETKFQWKHGNWDICHWIVNERCRSANQLLYVLCKNTPALWMLFCSWDLILSPKTEMKQNWHRIVWTVASILSTRLPAYKFHTRNILLNSVLSLRSTIHQKYSTIFFIEYFFQ